jgi:hypothetical protein
MVLGGKPIAEKIEGRLETVEAATIASLVAKKLGYGVDRGARRGGSGDQTTSWNFFAEYGGGKGYQTNTYGFIRESFRQAVAVRIGDARRDLPLTTNFWTFTDAGRFQPARAHLEELYDPEKLARVADQEIAARAAAVLAPDGSGDCRLCGEAYALVQCDGCFVSYYCSHEEMEADSERHEDECEALTIAMYEAYGDDSEEEDDEDEEEDEDGDEEEEEAADEAATDGVEGVEQGVSLSDSSHCEREDAIEKAEKEDAM